MILPPESPPSAGAGWRKLAVLGLAVAAVGLPVHQLSIYALLLIVTVVIFTGAATARARAWLGAVAIVAIAVAGQWLLSPPRIDEGHNVFLPGPADGVLQRALPPPVYRHLANEFDARYPSAVRCRPGSIGCWQGSHPTHAFAFSADGIFHRSDLSRSAAAIDFSDPVWLRLGFVNDTRYNWGSTPPDVHRLDRDRRFWMGLHRWHLAMPWFEVIRLPAAYVGGELCWRGEIMWEAADGGYSLWRGPGCRAIEAADAGRRVFGIAITPDSLAMQLAPPWPVQLRQVASLGLVLAAIVGLVVLLVRYEPRRTIVPFVLIGLAVLVIAIDDVSFLGGVRPFDGGDDGLFYDHVGRVILQKLLAGDIAGFLEGGEKVFYYGGPGLRYFRAIEHIIFGESYLGYLSLVLLLPFLTYWLFCRFLPKRWALAVGLVFVALPVGALFGTTFYQYAQWAARGFADSAAYILFIAGILTLVGPATSGPRNNFLPAFFSALLFALAIFMKPIVAPAAAVLLGGAGLAALYRRELARLVGLCTGFLPVFSMALHNWIYGHVFVLFSANAADSGLLVMPPSAYLAALRELFTLHFDGGYLTRALLQIPNWLSGPAESYATIPLNAAGVAILISVVIRGRGFDPWLRLIGAAALAQHGVALFYVATARYHFLTWLLTMVVAAAWLRQVGIVWLQRRYPDFCRRIAAHPWSQRLASGLSRLQEVSA
jgi:hypothetical protein